jgi:hypothetical protein
LAGRLSLLEIRGLGGSLLRRRLFHRESVLAILAFKRRANMFRLHIVLRLALRAGSVHKSASLISVSFGFYSESNFTKKKEMIMDIFWQL